MEALYQLSYSPEGWGIYRPFARAHNPEGALGRAESGSDLADTVTLRHRDSMEQERIPISELRARLEAAIF